MVVDGLDEATRPERVVSDVLGSLSRLGDPSGRPLIRFVVGVRSPHQGGPRSSSLLRSGARGTPWAGRLQA